MRAETTGQAIMTKFNRSNSTPQQPRRTRVRRERIFATCSRLLTTTLVLTACQTEDTAAFEDETTGSVETKEVERFVPRIEVANPADGEEEALGIPSRGAELVTRFVRDGGAAMPESPPSVDEGEFGEAMPVQLSWRSLEDRAGTSNTVELELRNDGEVPRELELRVLADDGGSNAQELDALSLNLAPGERQIHEIDLGHFVAQGRFDFAGQLTATARVHGVDGERESFGVSAPAVYLQPSERGVEVFGQDSLELEHAGGDINGLLASSLFASATDGEPTQTLRAVTHDDSPEMREAARAAYVAALGHEPAAASIDTSFTAEGDPLAADASQYTACFLFEIETLDSGYVNDAGYGEDYWATANSRLMVPGYGVRVRIGNQTYDTDPTSGCVTFSANSSVQDVRVYAYAKNNYNTYLRLHSGGRASNDTYPGSTYSWVLNDVDFSTSWTNYLAVGDYTANATAMGTLGFALYRYAYGVPNAAYHVTPDGECAGNYNYWMEPTVDAAYFQLEDATCSSTALRKKFVIGHEYGHALGALQAGYFKGQYYNHNVGPSACSMPTSTHYYRSKEWNLSAMMEGWGNYVAARIFNNQSSYGQFNNKIYNEDLERWDVGGAHSSGGYLENVCGDCPGCDAALAGSATQSDWMRQFWDMLTNGGCSNAPTTTDLLRLYGKTLNQPGLTFVGGWGFTQDAVEELVDEGQIGACYESNWSSWGNYNGVNH